MKLAHLYEDRSHRRIEQFIIKNIGTDLIRDLRKLNRGSSIKASGDRNKSARTRNFANSIDDDYTDRISFLQGVKPTWIIHDLKTLTHPKLKNLLKTRKIGKLDSDFMTSIGETLLYWSDYKDLATKTNSLAENFLAKSKELRQDGHEQKTRSYHAISHYLWGMLLGYEEHSVLNHATAALESRDGLTKAT